MENFQQLGDIIESKVGDIIAGDKTTTQPANNISDNEVISKVLEEITSDANSIGNYLSLSEILFNIIKTDFYNHTKRISERIKSEGIANIFGDDNDKISANNLSFEIKNMGGYLVYLKQREIELEDEIRRSKIQDDYYRWQGKLGKWLVKTRWCPLILSLLSIIIAGIALYFSIKYKSF